ncbi:DUF262 domain-containing protein [Salinibacterium sp. TMP30]|uniref:DUF262 domain-containing protein n=1 Tax=Salinibacterium sp. TMP30 TaxID=3138237 RepID=UPI0031391A1B
MRRRPNTQTVKWFLELDASGQLDLNPPYQRRSVWNDDYRRFYIDTILRDYPSPSIYLATETAPDLPTVHHVIDGKQRLETLIEFTKDAFHLGDYFSSEGYSAPYYSDLAPELRETLADYVLTVENITRTTDAEIKSAFERLNRNTAKLNRQELRKAQYEGKFISKMTGLAEDPLWTKFGMASRARISRMLDVEYVSEIYLLTMHGVLDGSPNLLDQFYSDYDSEIPDEDRTDAEYYATLEWFKGLELPPGRWNNLGDFYSLWAAILHLYRDGQLPPASRSAEILTEFGARVAEPESEDERRYSDAVRQGTNKESSRSTRANILQALLAE